MDSIIIICMPINCNSVNCNYLSTLLLLLLANLYRIRCRTTKYAVPLPMVILYYLMAGWGCDVGGGSWLDAILPLPLHYYSVKFCWLWTDFKDTFIKVIVPLSSKSFMSPAISTRSNTPNKSYSHTGSSYLQS